MEYCDFLECFKRMQLFGSSWAQSAHWLNVVYRPMGSAWQFSDISCELLLVSQVLFYLNSDVNCTYKSPHHPPHRPSKYQVQGTQFLVPQAKMPQAAPIRILEAHCPLC